MQQKAVAGILVPDLPPIWQPELWADALTALPQHVRSIAAADWSDIVTYLREPRDGGAVHGALFIILALVFAAARRKIEVWDKSGAENADKCAWTFGPTYQAANGALANMKLGARDFLIQRNWVNAAGGYCALSY